MLAKETDFLVMEEDKRLGRGHYLGAVRAADGPAFNLLMHV